MQEEAVYCVFQAGSKPGSQSNRATDPKRGRQNLESGKQANRVVTGRSRRNSSNAGRFGGDTQDNLAEDKWK